MQKGNLAFGNVFVWLKQHLNSCAYRLTTPSPFCAVDMRVPLTGLSLHLVSLVVGCPPGEAVGLRDETAFSALPTLASHREMPVDNLGKS